MCLFVDMVRTREPVPPDESVRVDALSVTEGPWRRIGERLLEMLRVPVNPPVLVRVMVELACEPRFIVRLAGLGVMLKSGVEPVGIVSGTGMGVPFAMSMQIPPPTLEVEFEQPVWNFMTVPVVVVAML